MFSYLQQMEPDDQDENRAVLDLNTFSIQPNLDLNSGYDFPDFAPDIPNNHIAAPTSASISASVSANPAQQVANSQIYLQNQIGSCPGCSSLRQVS